MILGSNEENNFDAGIKSLNRLPGKIGLCIELEFVSSQFHDCILSQQVSHPPIRVAGTFCDLYPFSVFVLKQNDVDTGRGFAPAGIKNVRSKLAHLNEVIYMKS